MNVPDLHTKGPEKCQERCRATLGCVWFTWMKLDVEDQGKCSRISKVSEIESNNSTKGIISGPSRCGGINNIKQK